MAAAVAGTWNLGGAATDRIFANLALAPGCAGPVGAELWTLQEIARGPPEWHAEEKEGWRIVSHRPVDAWRGTGITYRPAHWTLMRGKATSIGDLVQTSED